MCAGTFYIILQSRRPKVYTCLRIQWHTNRTAEVALLDNRKWWRSWKTGELEGCRHSGFMEMAGESSTSEGGKVPWQMGSPKPRCCELQRRGTRPAKVFGSSRRYLWPFAAAPWCSQICRGHRSGMDNEHSLPHTPPDGNIRKISMKFPLHSSPRVFPSI